MLPIVQQHLSPQLVPTLPAAPYVNMAKLSFLDVIHSQRLPAPPLIRADLQGQTVIVTGANTGLGLAAAKQFATMNPERLILACRSRDKGEQAVAGN
jgi:retinol dehydrogenase 12